MTKNIRDRKKPAKKARLPAKIEKRKPGFIDKKDIEQTIDDIEDKGIMPTKDILEERFPGMALSPIVRKEVYIRLITQLLLRGYKLGQMAQALGLHVDTIAEYKAQISKMWESDMGQMSILGHVGRSITNYRELQAQAAKIIYDTKNNIKPTPRILAINAAVNVEDRINHTLNMIGAFKNVQFTPDLANKSNQRSEIKTVNNIAEALLSGDEDIIDMVLENSSDIDENEVYKVSEKDIGLI